MDEDAGLIEVRLSRDLSFRSAAMMGITATVGAGIFVLLGYAAGQAGAALPLAIALNGLVAGLTAVTYADLGTTFPEAGGGYLWVREALPSPFAFAAGWITWFGHLVAGAVGALGFGYYVAWGLEGQGWLGPLTREGATILLALIVASIFVAFGYSGATTRRRSLGLAGFLKLAIVAVLVLFGALAVVRGPMPDLGGFFAKGADGVISAMVLTFVAFQGYEVIAQAGEEVRDPERSIPRAMFLSLAVVVVLYLAVALVALFATNPGAQDVPTFLGSNGATAIIEVGRQVVPTIGGPLLAVGGLVATLVALNASLFSASRLSFAMGRDRVLPETLGRVHPKFRAPSSAFLLSGLVLFFLVLIQNLVVVAMTAGLAFLFAFALVNWALIRWRQKHPEVRRGFTAPLFPLLPALGIAANGILLVLVAVQPGPGRLAWAIVVLWLGLGLLLYYPFRASEELAKPLPPRKDVAQVLAELAPPVELEKYRVLLPLRTFEESDLVRVGASLAQSRAGELSILNVLEIPPSLPPKAIRFHYVDERIKGLRKVERSAAREGLDTRTVVRIGHLPYEIILRTIEEEDVNLLVLGWRGGRPEGEWRILGSNIDYLVQRAPCDVVVARTRGLRDEVRSILLYVRSQEHADGAAAVAASLAADAGAKVTVLHVPEEGKTAPDPERVVTTLWKIGVQATVRALAARNAQEAVVQESANYDLLVLGAGEGWALSRHAFGPVVDQLAAAARCPVVMYRSKPAKPPPA